MPIPWLAALKVIPWGSILANAPEIARAADRLLSGTKTRATPGAPAGELQNLAARVDVLEQRDRETAELVEQIADQVAALSIASEVLQARARWLMVFSIVLTIVVIVLIGVVLIAR